MTDSLVSGPLETSSPFAGLLILESGEMLCSAIQSGSWIEGGMAAFSVAMDTLSMAVDPIGTLIAMGLGWLLENLEPLKGWLNTLTGNADEVAGFAQTWTNVAAHLKETGDDLLASMRRLDGLSGATIDAYRAVHRDAAAHIQASGGWAEAIAAGMQLASMIVGMVHDITRDAISTIVGTAISAAATTGLTLGIGAPAAAAQVATKVAALAGRVGKFITRLVRSLTNLNDMVRRLSDLLDTASGAFRNAVPNTGPRPAAPPLPVPPRRPPTSQERMAAVREAGRAGEEAAGIVKNTRRIDSATGTANYRIPDELNDFVLGEVKNVARLPYTNQLKDFLAYAEGQAPPLRFVIYTRPSTALAPDLQALVDAGRIIIDTTRLAG